MLQAYSRPPPAQTRSVCSLLLGEVGAILRWLEMPTCMSQPRMATSTSRTSPAMRDMISTRDGLQNSRTSCSCRAQLPKARSPVAVEGRFWGTHAACWHMFTSLYIQFIVSSKILPVSSGQNLHTAAAGMSRVVPCKRRPFCAAFCGATPEFCLRPKTLNPGPYSSWANVSSRVEPTGALPACASLRVETLDLKP